jgi:hypothetical protein
MWECEGCGRDQNSDVTQLIVIRQIENKLVADRKLCSVCVEAVIACVRGLLG